MQYRVLANGKKVSRFGFGAMRMPQKGEGFSAPLIEDKATRLIRACYEKGINYFDTAYIYHGGESEGMLAKALSVYPRESYYLADKFNVQAESDYRKQFEAQLERLHTDYIDFYLLHGVSDELVGDFFDHGAVEYFEEERARGRIRNFGFSFHGSNALLKELLKRHKWDFVQIQLNYYDWFFGQAKEQYEMLTEAGIPVISMESCHGGLLAKLEPDEKAILSAMHPDWSPASWAFRFLKDLDGLAVMLSGMGNAAELEDNMGIFESDDHLGKDEMDALYAVAAKIHSRLGIPCTACRYCTSNCPQGLDIPYLLAAYNEFRSGGTKERAAWRLERLGALEGDKRPSACIACGSCTSHCPQHIDIPSCMNEMAAIIK